MGIPTGIKEYYSKFNADEKLAKRAYAERNKGGSRHDIFEPHSLSEGIIDAFLEIFLPIEKDIDEVYLVKRKVTYVSEDPMWVIIVKSDIRWYKIYLSNPKNKVGNYLSERLRGFFAKGTYAVTVDFPMYIKKAKAISGSLIYKKHTFKNLFTYLRKKALEFPLEAFQEIKITGDHSVYGVIMETGFLEGVATLITFISGDASIYLSNGGGMIGGIGHENVRKAAIDLNYDADKYIPSCRQVNNYPLPKAGETIFYILAKKGIYTARISESDLGKGKHFMSPLFYSAQEVITQFRLIEKKHKK